MSLRLRRKGLVAAAAFAAVALDVAACTHDFDSLLGGASDDASATGDSFTANDASGSNDTSSPNDGATPSDASDAALETSTEASTDASPYACATDAGAIAFGGHCYFVTAAPGTFDVTRAACVTAGAHLLTVASAGEQAAAAPLATSAERWIGLARASDAGATDAAAFGWITGEPNTFAHWTAGEPNGSGPCVRMKTDGTWADQACATSLAAICEHE